MQYSESVNYRIVQKTIEIKVRKFSCCFLLGCSNFITKKYTCRYKVYPRSRYPLKDTTKGDLAVLLFNLHVLTRRCLATLLNRLVHDQLDINDHTTFIHITSYAYLVIICFVNSTVGPCHLRRFKPHVENVIHTENLFH